GGNIIDDEEKLKNFLDQFATIKYKEDKGEVKKILVHGGGKLATKMAEDLQVPQRMIDGRRITDSETLKIVTMVYAGYVNKNIVAQLGARGCTVLGLSGADGNLIQAHKRITATSVDYGFVGDVDFINTDLLQLLLGKELSIVIAPITHNNEGQLLNTNADTIAQEIAKALSPYYNTQLIYSFEKEGVLAEVQDDASVIKKMDAKLYTQLKEEKAIFAGMIPKLDNAFTALQSGVSKVIIGKAEKLHQLIEGTSGTTISNE
ncbi:MAG TPA: acetylglutamate kinase, partial [Chitinophagaceae bacterium]|nr:acetylglutamate kinase [Chitinophagaceae bacterium]